MASSTFEVTEKEINFGLEACDENEIVISAQIDGEIPMDHNYTKDPDESEEDVTTAGKILTEIGSIESPDKNSTKAQKTVKNSKRVKVIKEKKTSAKRVPASKGIKKKKILTEDSSKADINSKDKSDTVQVLAKMPKRNQKRKAEEKENVIDRSIVEEIQNINEPDSTSEVKVTPAKKKKMSLKNTPKVSETRKLKNLPSGKSGESPAKLPNGWTRKEVIRQSGKTAGRHDVYYYSPEGLKFRSRPDIAAYLAKSKIKLNITEFTFSKGKTSIASPVKKTPKKVKALVTPKPKKAVEKKKVKTSPLKKKKGLVVKLNFAKKGKSIPKKQGKSPAKKAKSPGFKAGEKKKST